MEQSIKLPTHNQLEVISNKIDGINSNRRPIDDLEYIAEIIKLPVLGSSTLSVLGMNSNGRIFAGTSHYISYTDDWGDTWVTGVTSDNIGKANYVPTIRNIITLDTNKILLMATEGSVWKSNEDYTVITKVLESVGGTGFGESNFTRYENVILAGNYGSTNETLQVWMSMDYGDTWKRVMNENPAVNWNHMHDVRYDPYENILWATNGDDYANYASNVNRIWFSSDYGTTWNWIGGVRTTAIIPLPECVLFISDVQNRASVFRLDRPSTGIASIMNRDNIPVQLKDIAIPAEEMRPPYGIKEAFVCQVYKDETAAFTWAGKAFVDYGKDSKVVFSFRANKANPHPLVIWGTRDGYRITRIWSSDEVMPNDGACGVYGEDNDGNLVANISIYDENREQKSHMLKLSPKTV